MRGIFGLWLALMLFVKKKLFHSTSFPTVATKENRNGCFVLFHFLPRFLWQADCLERRSSFSPALYNNLTCSPICFPDVCSASRRMTTWIRIYSLNFVRCQFLQYYSFFRSKTKRDNNHYLALITDYNVFSFYSSWSLISAQTETKTNLTLNWAFMFPNNTEFRNIAKHLTRNLYKPQYFPWLRDKRAESRSPHELFSS